MSYKQMTGNIISATKVEPNGVFTNSAASGVWNLQDQYDYVRGGNWPNAANLVPRALFAGGRTGGSFPANTNVIDYVTITTTGNATDFGDLTSLTQQHGAFSSSSRAVFFGGKAVANGTGQGTATNVIQYVTIASTGDAADFGDLTAANAISPAGVSSNIRGVRVGGQNPDVGVINVMDYVTIASTGNATDFGDMDAPAMTAYSCNSSTRGIVSGGGENSILDVIQYITIASAGDSTDFGNLGSALYQGSSGIVSSATRGIVAMGGRDANNYVPTIEYVTIASTGNATDFGDLSTNTRELGSASSTIRGLAAGGLASNTPINNIQYITIANTGDSTDFGDLTLARYRFTGASNSHGGIAA